MDDLGEWAELSNGVYLHRWRVELLIVVAELGMPEDLLESMSESDWEVIRRQILTDARLRHAEVMDAGIHLHDVRIVEGVSHV